MIIRASSLPDLFDCAMRWGARHIDGLSLPSSGAAQLGTAVHAATAVYDQGVIDDASITPDDAAGAAVDAIRRPDDDVDWSDIAADKAEAKAIALHKMYCSDIAPGQQYAGVEVRCESLTVDVDGYPITLTGTTDRIRETPAGRGIADIKTGKTAVGTDGVAKTRGHGLQLAVYTVLAEQATGEQLDAPPAIIGLNSGAPRAAIAELPNAREALIGRPGELGALEIAAGMLQAGLFPPNPRSMLCGRRFCPLYDRCTYR